jgi:peptidoglycan/xylan/chitin deacetylase (PgdA/CDA1 family)
MYFVKAPNLLKKIYPKGLVWDIKSEDAIYLTFDDGPHPEATPFVLSELEKYKALATFFCIGKNVLAYPKIYQKIIEKGHKIGNHTYSHLNGWHVNNETYLEDILKAQKLIQSNLFRPPYGRIKKNQAKCIQNLGYQIILWDVLSGDFDEKISPEKCWENIKKNIKPGCIIVFHDSSKAFERMKYALPKTLELCIRNNWKMNLL